MIIYIYVYACRVTMASTMDFKGFTGLDPSGCFEGMRRLKGALHCQPGDLAVWPSFSGAFKAMALSRFKLALKCKVDVGVPVANWGKEWDSKWSGHVFARRTSAAEFRTNQ